MQWNACVCMKMYETRAVLTIQCNFAFIIVQYPYFLLSYYPYFNGQALIWWKFALLHVHKINDNNSIQLLLLLSIFHMESLTLIHNSCNQHPDILLLPPQAPNMRIPPHYRLKLYSHMWKVVRYRVYICNTWLKETAQAQGVNIWNSISAKKLKRDAATTDNYNHHHNRPDQDQQAQL